MITQLQNNPAIKLWKSTLKLQLDQLDLAMEEWDELENRQLELIEKSWAPIAESLASNEDENLNPAVAATRQAVDFSRDVVSRSLNAQVAMHRGARRMTRSMLKGLHGLAS